MFDTNKLEIDITNSLPPKYTSTVSIFNKDSREIDKVLILLDKIKIIKDKLNIIGYFDDENYQVKIIIDIYYSNKYTNSSWGDLDNYIKAIIDTLQTHIYNTKNLHPLLTSYYENVSYKLLKDDVNISTIFIKRHISKNEYDSYTILLEKDN